MSKVVEMSEHLKKGDLRDQANFTFRLFLIVDAHVYETMEWLRGSLEAPSLGDVVRQAVRAYALNRAEVRSVE